MVEMFNENSNMDSNQPKNQISLKTLVFSIIGALAFMFLICLVVFFANVKGEEQVLVPNVVGKNWSEALIEMQQKELYPKIQLRYTDSADDYGQILAQKPVGGSITKAGARISLTISRGIITSHVENYVGQNIDDVRRTIQSLFANTNKVLLHVDSPTFKTDSSPAGTILAQTPPEGTAISEPITLKFIVSRGSAEDSVKVPNYVGMSVQQLLRGMEKSNLVFDFSSHIATRDEKYGTITRQEIPADQTVKNYSRITLDVALPEKEIDGKLYGVIETKIPNYPFPVEMRVESEKDGNKSTLATFYHSGGNFTFPYVVEKNTELIVYASGKEIRKIKVE